MRTQLINGRILTPDGLRDDIVVIIDGDRILSVGPSDPSLDAETCDLDGGLLVPGFIDTQVNGGGGALFNADPSVETIATIGETHRRFGTTGFLPTLLSDDLEVVDRGIEAVEAAIHQGVPGVLGIHIEGPFLNLRRKGIHDASKFRVLEQDMIERLTRLRKGRTLITLAPEMTSPDLIRRLVTAGARVSAGHTDADHSTMRSAFAAGVTGVTHLFNAMPALQNRAPGVVGAALEDQQAWCGLIVDGHHVDPVVLKLGLRCRPLDRFMLVTDAMPSVGLKTDHFHLQGRRINVRDGVCTDDQGVLAGSDLDMATAFRNTIALLDVDLAAASTMASAAPAAFLGLAGERGRIAPGQIADLALLNDDLVVASTWISGRPSSSPADLGEPGDART
ncbi:N-acetylglucosamine-6-phosphate deacetylase [Brevundimonas sp. VNH65]|uniref:N-acetylglucosamine-6-phosphate deacetylase n=1 Tax=Brevundimonas sp. VNH65 TaxID=3400917 RepID=UPI003C0C357C